VWCCVDPTVSIKQLAESYVPDSVTNRSIVITTPHLNDLSKLIIAVANNLSSSSYGSYDKCFIQAGSPGVACINIQFLSNSDNPYIFSIVATHYSTCETQINPEQIISQQAESCLTGFSLKTSTSKVLFRTTYDCSCRTFY
jgi:hypothetical protein